MLILNTLNEQVLVLPDSSLDNGSTVKIGEVSHRRYEYLRVPREKGKYKDQMRGLRLLDQIHREQDSRYSLTAVVYRDQGYIIMPYCHWDVDYPNVIPLRRNRTRATLPFLK